MKYGKVGEGGASTLKVGEGGASTLNNSNKCKNTRDTRASTQPCPTENHKRHKGKHTTMPDRIKHNSLVSSILALLVVCFV